MSDTTVTLVGNMTRDIELRFTPSGQAVGEFGVAVNKRVKGADGQWEDGDPEFYDVTAWGTLAENAVDTLAKGSRVLVVGRLQFDTWENEAGEKRTKVKVVADHLGPDLRWATATINRNEKGATRPAAAPARHATPADPDEAPF